MGVYHRHVSVAVRRGQPGSINKEKYGEESSMRKCLIVASIIAAFILVGTTVQAADKIGFVDIKKILSESEAGKEATRQIMQHVEKKQGEIEAMEAELQKRKDELEKQRSVLTDAAYREKEIDYRQRTRDYQRFVEDANEEVKMREQRMTQALIPDIQKVINDIGDKEGYTAIFDVGTMGLLFNSDKYEITGKVIEQYNKMSRSK
jgi:outer membrane protein